MLDRTRMQKMLTTIVVLIGLFPLGYFLSIEIGIAQASASSTDTALGTSIFDRYVANDAFGTGEKLIFDIGYGFINAGTATMEVASFIEYEGRPCYLVRTTAKSNDFFSSVYRVEDEAESIMDAVGMFSWKFEKHLREGSYRSDREYAFDQRNNSVVYKGDTITIAPFVQDALSILYYIRTQPLEVGKSIRVDTFIDGRKLDIEVFVRKRETITVDAGTFDCLVVEPISQSVGIFKHQGKLKVWLTDDRLRMPVLMKTKVVVGSITAELTDYQLGELADF